MTDATTSAAEERVVVLMTTSRDADRAANVLAEAHVSTRVCNDTEVASKEIRMGVGALLVTDDILAKDAAGHLASALREQPTWSAIPVIVIAQEGTSAHVERALSATFTSLIVVERPVRIHSLTSVVLSALRARRHQVEIRDTLLALERSREELANRAEELKANDQRKDEFLAMLAHELRNPLAPVQTGLDVLKTSMRSPAEERVIGVMGRQLTHMVRLIDDLMDVSRITRGKLVLRKESISLQGVLEAAIEATRGAMEAAHHTFRFEPPTVDVRLQADSTRLAQVVGNLLNNAAKYTPPGGHVVLSTHVGEGQVTLRVTDDGVGIPPDRLEDVFEMFTQVEWSLPGSRAGLGIGLALVRSLVRMHGGTVSVRSEGAGKGTSFEVVLPTIAQTKAHTSSAAPEAATHKSERCILIVDDNADAAELLAMLLERSGYKTEVAHDGKSALLAARTFAPDMAVLDIGLPDMSGYDLARAMRTECLAPLGLVALTGWGAPMDRDAALEAGFDIHVTKPVDEERIRKALLQLESKATSAPAI